jgi:hypothetical protein
MPSASLFLDESASDVLMAPCELYGAGRRSVRPTPVLCGKPGMVRTAERLIHTFPNADDCFLDFPEEDIVVFIGPVQSVENSRLRWSEGYPPVIYMWETRVQTPVCVHSR